MKKIFLSIVSLAAMSLAAAGITPKLFVIEYGKGELPLLQKNGNGKVTLSNKDFSWEIAFVKRGKLDNITGTIHNKTKRQLLLEPGMKVVVPRQKGDFYWAGFDVKDAGRKIIARKGLKGKTSKHLQGGLNTPFPVSTLISKDKAYILGGRIYEITSYTGAEYRPAKDGKSAEIRFSQRIVLEPGEKLILNFLAGTVPVRFDREENVVEAFYEAFPADSAPKIPKDNPALMGTYSQYTAWCRKPDYELERRRFATLDWAYTPFKRSGDWYGRKEFWDYKPLNRDFEIKFAQLSVGENFDYKKLTLEEFHKKRQSIFKRYGRKFGFSFYICSVWSEKQLAEEHFQDSLTVDPDHVYSLKSWCTGHDQERRVFPIGGSFGKVFKESITGIVKDLDLPGFSVDCGTPGVNFYGVGAQLPTTKGRAWDDKGKIFCDEICALNQLFPWIRNLRPDDPLHIWKNGDGDSDVALFEADVFGPVFPSWMPLTRYMAGQRPAIIHVHQGYLFEKTIPDWRKLSLDEFLFKWQKLGDHLTLNDFEYGTMNSTYGYGGNLQSQYSMPELIECIRTGWRALIPVKTEGQGDNMLYRARYGRKENTILFYGNPYNEAMPLTFTIDNSGLGGGYQVFLPKMRDKARLANSIANGDTVVKTTVPSRKPFLIEAAFSFDKLPADSKLDAEVSTEKDIHFMRYSAKLNGNAPFKAAVTPRTNEYFTAKLFINGKETAIGKETTIPANALITAEYTSTRFANGAKEITSFPFTDKDNKPSFAVSLAADANEDEKELANYVKDYFRFTEQRKITNGKELLKADSGVPEVKISIRKGNKSFIKREGNTITLTAPDFRNAKQMYIALARVMDKRFVYFDPISIHYKPPAQIAEKFGVKNLKLNYTRCFESDAK